MAKSKSKIKRPVGRPRVCFTYDEAKHIVQLEGLQSVKDYDKWWLLNHPCRIPKRPDRAYKSEGFKWNEFLGTKQIFPQPRKKWRPYDEARQYALSLGIKTQQDWINFAKTDECPDDIPMRPDITYRRTMKWISWRDWLGTDLSKRHEELSKGIRPILYVIKVPNRPGNVYKINIMLGKIETLTDLQQQDKIRIVRTFYLDKAESDWQGIVDRHCTPYYKGEDNEYISSNVAQLISELTYSFQPILLP